MSAAERARATVLAGEARLGIEFGSTRIKACLVDASGAVIGTGSCEWENRLVDGRWSYALDDVRLGARAAYAALIADVEARTGAAPTRFAAIGVSAMMHGYLAFDRRGTLLTPFRTWRNTGTARAATALTERFGVNVPLRWSVAHFAQAMLDEEPHVVDVARLTTLAGYVHAELTGEHVLGIGDASGVFPLQSGEAEYDRGCLDAFDVFAAEQGHRTRISEVLPRILLAGQHAGALTDAGAAWLDPVGRLQAGAPCCPPEGDAGTGMVATGAVTPRTGNVSVGTSVFAMVVLERRPARVRTEIDLVATPDGVDVAMVHCNNGAAELGKWAAQFIRFAEAAGHPIGPDRVFEILLGEAMQADADADGCLALNLLAGEPVLGLSEGRPLTVRPSDAEPTLANAARAQLNAVFAALAVGMRALAGEGIAVDRITAHGGLFRTPHTAERVLAAALDAEVVVPSTAPEGGAWGMAVLASYLLEGRGRPLGRYLEEEVLCGVASRRVLPDPAAVSGYARALERTVSALPVACAAIEAVP